MSRPACASSTAGEADATLLALAGLNRLGLQDKATRILETEEFLPAVGQGAIAIESRRDDDRINAFVKAIGDADTELALSGGTKLSGTAGRLLSHADRWSLSREWRPHSFPRPHHFSRWHGVVRDHARRDAGGCGRAWRGRRAGTARARRREILHAVRRSVRRGGSRHTT